MGRIVNINSAKLMVSNTDFVIAFTFALGGLAARAGAHGPVNPKIDPDGYYEGLKAFVAAVLGGSGTSGRRASALLIGAAETWW